MSVSQPPIRRAWSGLVTMLWPSMMSLAPPPVTPRRKFPPFFGAPAGVDPPPLPAVEDEPLPPQAARPPASRTPPAPMSSSRRERESRSKSAPASGLRLSTIESPFVVWREVQRAGSRRPADGADNPPSPRSCQVERRSHYEPGVRKMQQRQGGPVVGRSLPAPAATPV